MTAADVIAWIEKHCYIPEGRFVGKPVRLEEWQKAEIRKIYDNPHGTRRAIISWGRKNAKTTFAAFLLLCHLCGVLAIHNSQLYSTAQSREQASIIFNLAAKIVRISPILIEYVQIRDTAKELLCPELGTKYRALSADATTAYGLSPVFVVHDELGQVQGPRSSLYDALETATAAQDNPLSIIISTQAPTDNDLLSVLIDDAEAGHDPRTVVSLFTAPDDMDPFTEEAIRLANPAFDSFMNKREVLAMAADAKRMPSREAEFRNLVLNQRIDAENSFIAPSLWKACGKPINLDRMLQVDLYAGLDLSAVQDLTALVMIGRVDNVWHVKPTFWLPAVGLREKAGKDRVPYDLWHEQGFLETTPGNTIRYQYIAEYLRGVFDAYPRLRKVGFDRWNFKHLLPWLEQAGFDDQFIAEHFVEFGQGTQSMSPALRDLEAEINDERVAHGNHPVLTMCAANAVIEGRPGEKPDDSNRKLSKKRSRGRIDGLVALAMAFGVAPVKTQEIDISAMIG